MPWLNFALLVPLVIGFVAWALMARKVWRDVEAAKKLLGEARELYEGVQREYRRRGNR